MANRAMKRWWPILLLVFGFPVAAAATLSITGAPLGAGAGIPPTCDSSPTIVQNVGTLLNASNIVSVDVSGIVAACGGGTVRVTVFNNTDAAQETTKAIPASGGSVNLTLGTPVALKEAHLVSVTLQGP
jgi:hypothetical protein